MYIYAHLNCKSEYIRHIHVCWNIRRWLKVLLRSHEVQWMLWCVSHLNSTKNQPPSRGNNFSNHILLRIIGVSLCYTSRCYLGKSLSYLQSSVHVPKCKDDTAVIENVWHRFEWLDRIWTEIWRLDSYGHDLSKLAQMTVGQMHGQTVNWSLMGPNIWLPRHCSSQHILAQRNFGRYSSSPLWHISMN